MVVYEDTDMLPLGISRDNAFCLAVSIGAAKFQGSVQQKSKIFNW